MALAKLLENAKIADSKEYLNVVSEDAQAQLIAAMVKTALPVDQVQQMVTESSSMNLNPVEERAMLKLSSVAENTDVQDLSVLQCAMEDGNETYKKLEVLWATEATLMEGLRNEYKDQANARVEQVAEGCSCSQAGPIQLAAGICTCSASAKDANSTEGKGAQPIQKDPNQMESGTQGNFAANKNVAGMHSIRK